MGALTSLIVLGWYLTDEDRAAAEASDPAAPSCEHLDVEAPPVPGWAPGDPRIPQEGLPLVRITDLCVVDRRATFITDTPPALHGAFVAGTYRFLIPSRPLTAPDLKEKEAWGYVEQWLATSATETPSE